VSEKANEPVDTNEEWAQPARARGWETPYTTPSRDHSWPKQLRTHTHKKKPSLGPAWRSKPPAPPPPLSLSKKNTNPKIPTLTQLRLGLHSAKQAL
jgi:hypothetical protein